MLILPFAALLFAAPIHSDATPPSARSCAVEIVTISQPIAIAQLQRVQSPDGIRVVPDTLAVKPIQHMVIDPDGD